MQLGYSESSLSQREKARKERWGRHRLMHAGAPRAFAHPNLPQTPGPASHHSGSGEGVLVHVSTRRFTCGAQAYCLSQRERNLSAARWATVPLRVHRDTRLVTAGTMELSQSAWDGMRWGRALIARAMGC